MYYYLKELKGYDIRIIGLDLKKDVIKNCSRLAVKYGYDKLNFYEGSIEEFEGVTQVDMVVTLHACDTATDYALYKACLLYTSQNIPTRNHRAGQDFLFQ